MLSNTPHTFTTRFAGEDGTAGTNTEELIAAAHARCFTMKLSSGVSPWSPITLNAALTDEFA
ncbi:MAG: hypothetical protein IPL52_10415 [Flavobacteriales bacterium]|nr:hypothetical protein [Flavobacteriales bacterium]